MTPTELKVSQEPLLEPLNKVSTAQRVARVQGRCEGVGPQQEVHKEKQTILHKAARKRSIDR